jgi:hypothetical protein
LRTGDLTLPFEPNNTVGVQEVKAGTSQRAAQSRAIERKLRFLADGEGTEVFDGDHSRLVRYPIAMRTHLAALTEVVTRARDDGYASAHPSPSLLVIAVDPRVSRGDPGIEAFDEQVRAEAGWKDEPRIIRMLSIVRRMRERLHHFPYLAPLTIFPLRAADIAELILGPLEFMVTLNAPVLEAQFEAAGISAEVITNQPGSYSTFLKASRGDAQVELSALIGEQMLGELLEPQMLIEGVDFMLSEIERGHEGKALVGFADEAATWAGT